MLDLDGNGIELTARTNSNVYFDMDGDGIKELTGWVSKTDGLLAIDGNANGTIDNINELIGDLGQSGFEELIKYDLNKDRIINASDAVWSTLRVWVDADGDGTTDSGELKTLSSLNIKAIDLNFTAVNFTAEGNRIHEQSVFEYTNGTTGLVADILFDVSNVATDSSVSLTGNVTVDKLPDIRGRGDVESLLSVMLNDGALATLVAGFIGQGSAKLGDARAQIEQIIYRWAGVQAVDTGGRGGLFDGRKLAALEAFLGTEFLVQGNANPNAQAVGSLAESRNGLVDGIQARLVMSGPLGKAIAGSAVYVAESDRLLTVQTPAELFASFKAKVPAGDALVQAGYWATVLPLAREIVQDVGGNPASEEYQAARDAALQNLGLSPFADLLDDGIVPLGTLPSILQTEGVYRLTANADTLWLGPQRNVVFAGDGDDFVAVAENFGQAQNLNGGAGNDQLFGASADDWLHGGAGADTMAGGAGDDTYTVDNTGDVVTEAESGGDDHVRSSVSYVLGTGLEHLTLLGAAVINATGNAASNRITGNGAANRLEGLAGNDTLDGGAGADTMVGGTGADLYRVDAAGDVIIETGGDVDTVEASVSYKLASRLENLVLTGSAVNATGNSANNTLTGNALNNALNGGTGADSMFGGLGNDTYVVDNGSDYVQENEAEGTDRVQSSVSYSLGSHVENLILTGSDDINGTGNEMANQITGNAGDNEINGGAGADRMTGGAGDDRYVVDTAGDTVVEAADGGTDWVQTALAAYTLANNIEHLRLYTDWTGDDGANRNGTGNALGNEIVGTNGINTLTGLGGNDRLFGNGGADSLLGGDNDDYLDGGADRDRMEGGAGNDQYVVDLTTDVVVEAANAGTDTVISSVSWILGANVENLILTEVGQLDGQGNALNNRITGNSWNNAIDGGAGADTMAGGSGDDTYTVDNTGDVVTELPGSGIDTVRSSVSYALGNFVENLSLIGSSNISATGNASDNTLIGNAGANIITGGMGRDTLTGGAGADTFMFGGPDTGSDPSVADLITDFNSGQGDRINLSAIDARSESVTDNVFTFIGEANFTAAGQIRVDYDGSNTFVYMNVDSETDDYDFLIVMSGNLNLGETNFIL